MEVKKIFLSFSQNVGENLTIAGKLAKFYNIEQGRRDDRCAAMTKTSMNMSTRMNRRLIVMTAMSTATRLLLIVMSTPITMGTTITGTPAATNGKPRFC